jgi:CRP-like cAMP-binding protein
MSGRFIASLEVYGRLSATEREALGALVGANRAVAAGKDIVCAGQATSECHLLLSGQAFRHRTLADGRRQIMSYHVAGDLIDVQGLFLSLDYSVGALTACEVAPLSRARFEDLVWRYPNLGRALWRYSLVEGAIFREWMVGMGRRTAYARIAHLLCELVTRFEAVGLARNGRYRFPLTQTHIADSLGLSNVHTNRVLQALREDGLIDYRGRELVVLDWQGLRAAGEFDPDYLHMGAAAA